MSLIHAAATLAADAPDYVVQLQAGTHAMTGDEAPREGGQGVGPAPFELVLAGLAQCTAATLRMYMQRKTWPAARIDVRTELHADREGQQYVRRVVTLDGPLDDAQRTRLAEICEKTPVTQFVKRGTRIETTLN
ncbi:OsmC family protein [Burkholderia vietnamiensis]|uniref:OsmC family protein n=1 Tax=Burkholderia vietnamiensis TaxID=60552 RepID=UPI00075493B9|nr:OsmC family protein [Burkholderia vietnamiensis]KVE56571.1 peroxiredoxin [Burkholderia vietnamiensis]KVE90108.1 peroxiredoxin [Burkholderia vietnamiensis]MDN7927278.1 OsmC family protein [Burkholderia vietnamiensis]HDR9249365.1 OsmC family protein [Burkholderia vietnamiensis]